MVWPFFGYLTRLLFIIIRLFITETCFRIYSSNSTIDTMQLKFKSYWNSLRKTSYRKIKMYGDGSYVSLPPCCIKFSAGVLTYTRTKLICERWKVNIKLDRIWWLYKTHEFSALFSFAFFSVFWFLEHTGSKSNLKRDPPYISSLFKAVGRNKEKEKETFYSADAQHVHLNGHNS